MRLKHTQTIEGYTYTKSYSEETKYVCSEYDFVYIYGYPDGSVQGEGNMTRAEATARYWRSFPPVIAMGLIIKFDVRVLESAEGTTVTNQG